MSQDRKDRNIPIRPHAKTEDVDTSDEQVSEEVIQDKELQEEEGDGGDQEEFRAVACGGEEAVKSARTPGKPTQQEIENHELSHCPPRSWCDHCVKGQAKDDPSRKVLGDLADSDVTRVAMDYCYLTEDVVTKDDEHQTSTTARVSMTVLAMKETLCQSVWAYAVKTKGAGEAWIVDQIVEDMETIGLAQEKIILKADQEVSMTDVQKAIVKARAGHGTALEQSRVGDSNSNGRVERSIQDLKGLIRTLRSATEEKTGEKIHLEDPIVPWMVRHAGHLITRFRVRENGRTSFQMMKGRRSNSKLVPFGETVLFKIPKTEKKTGDSEDRWEQCIWVGFIIRSGEHLVATKMGVFKVSTVMRRLPDKRWSADLIKAIKGSPEEPVPGSSSRRITAFAKKFEGDGEKVRFAPQQEREAEVRVAYIYKQDIDEHGPSERCPGCKAVMSGGRYRAKHTDACRERFEKLLIDTEQGKKRLDAARERKEDDETRRAQKDGEDAPAGAH